MSVTQHVHVTEAKGRRARGERSNRGEREEDIQHGFEIEGVRIVNPFS